MAPFGFAHHIRLHHPRRHALAFGDRRRSARRLQDRGIDVTVLMTKAATQFVTPLTFRALSGNKVYLDMFEGPRSGGDFEGAFDHILVAQSINLFLIAPATADCKGTPASMSESEAPQTVAMEDEPLDSRMSETTRMA